MNKKRRKRLEKCNDILQKLIEEIESIEEEENEAFENLPESLQESEKGDKMQ